MNITLMRNPSMAGATMGRMYIDGVFACHTLEDEMQIGRASCRERV